MSGSSFARFYFDSSATSVDREYGSGMQSDNVPMQPGSLCMGIRYGEARHPGPDVDQLLNLGVSNPGGLRSKEDMVLMLGPGIWTLTETQLSSVTTKNAARAFKAGGRKLDRLVRPHFGHPAPLRQGSTWAGKWTGVCTVSDWPSMSLRLPWTHEHWSTGRMLLTRHWIHGFPITVGGFYGYAQGPTWPAARQLNDQLLETFTQEFVIGMSGVRLLVGDFNFEPSELVQQQIWERHGWCNAQSLAAQTLLHEWRPTCKGVKERDQIWLSPEAAQLLRGISFEEQFADHLTVMIQLLVPSKTTRIQPWPRPSNIPWHCFNPKDWCPPCPVLVIDISNATVFMQKLAESYVNAIDAEMKNQQQPSLQTRCRGRAQRLAPVKQVQSAPVCKPA